MKKCEQMGQLMKVNEELGIFIFLKKRNTKVNEKGFIKRKEDFINKRKGAQMNVG